MDNYFNEAACQPTSRLEQLLKPVEEPIIGLHFVLELASRHSVLRTFVCSICQRKFEESTIVDHLTSSIHRLCTMKLIFNDQFEWFKKFGLSQEKLNLHLESWAKEIESIRGRGKCLVEFPDTENVLAQLQIKIPEFKSHSKPERHDRSYFYKDFYKFVETSSEDLVMSDQEMDFIVKLVDKFTEAIFSYKLKKVYGAAYKYFLNKFQMNRNNIFSSILEQTKKEMSHFAVDNKHIPNGLCSIKTSPDTQKEMKSFEQYSKVEEKACNQPICERDPRLIAKRLRLSGQSAKNDSILNTTIPSKTDELMSHTSNKLSSPPQADNNKNIKINTLKPIILPKAVKFRINSNNLCPPLQAEDNNACKDSSTSTVPSKTLQAEDNNACKDSFTSTVPSKTMQAEDNNACEDSSTSTVPSKTLQAENNNACKDSSTSTIPSKTLQAEDNNTCRDSSTSTVPSKTLQAEDNDTYRDSSTSTVPSKTLQAEDNNTYKESSTSTKFISPSNNKLCSPPHTHNTFQIDTNLSFRKPCNYNDEQHRNIRLEDVKLKSLLQLQKKPVSLESKVKSVSLKQSIETPILQLKNNTATTLNSIKNPVPADPQCLNLCAQSEKVDTKSNNEDSDYTLEDKKRNLARFLQTANKRKNNQSDDTSPDKIRKIDDLENSSSNISDMENSSTNISDMENSSTNISDMENSSIKANCQNSNTSPMERALEENCNKASNTKLTCSITSLDNHDQTDMEIDNSQDCEEPIAKLHYMYQGIQTGPFYHLN